MADQPISHGLGVGNGSMIEHSDGTVEYRPTGKFLPAFRVRISDVVGFSVRRVTRDDKKRLKASSMQEVITLQGSGTVLAEAAVNYGTASKIEEWIRRHPLFGAGRVVENPVQPSNTIGPALIADELIKLAQLRDAGVLTPAEFDAQKARLLG